MKVLVVKPTALGDVAQAVKIVPLLKKWPLCRELVWLVDEDYAPLLEHCAGIDRLIRFPRRRWRNNWLCPETLSWLGQLREERFDVVLDLQGLARSAVMTMATGAARRVGLKSGREMAFLAYTELVPDGQTHAVDRYLAAAAVLTGESSTEPVLPALQMGETGLPPGLSAGQYTVLHPYSQWTTKLWNWQNYEILARILPEERFVIVGQGPFFPISAPNIIDLRNRSSLEELLVLIGQSRALISTDSGPLHLAAAFDKPVVAVFGASDPEKTGPHTAVRRIVTTTLPCRPCLLRKCRYYDCMACMTGITAGEVAAAWREVAKMSKSGHFDD